MIPLQFLEMPTSKNNDWIKRLNKKEVKLIHVTPGENLKPNFVDNLLKNHIKKLSHLIFAKLVCDFYLK